MCIHIICTINISDHLNVSFTLPSTLRHRLMMESKKEKKKKKKKRLRY